MTAFTRIPCHSQRKTSSNDRIPGQVEFSCPEEFGYYPHPNDCTQYYVCVFGGAVLESCTGGLMYSHELQTCDWPRNVGCDGVASVFTDEEPIQSPQRSKPLPSLPQQQIQNAPPRIPPRQRDELLTKPLYEEEELGPAEEIESDRQQRVYRGQPPTLGQVARDRDGIAKHANALQTSPGVKQHVPFQYSDPILTSMSIDLRHDKSDTHFDETTLPPNRTIDILCDNTDQSVTIDQTRSRTKRQTQLRNFSTNSSLDKNLLTNQRVTRRILIQNPNSKQKPPDNSISAGNYQLRYVPSPPGAQVSHSPHNIPLSNEQYTSKIPYPQNNIQHRQNAPINIMQRHPGQSNVHGRSVMQSNGYNNWGQNVLPIHNLFPAVSANYISTPNPMGGYTVPINHQTPVRPPQYQYSPSTPYQYVPGSRGTVSNAILTSSRQEWLDHTTKPYNSYTQITPPSETVHLLYPPGSKTIGTKSTEKDETKDATVIKDEIRDKKSTKRQDDDSDFDNERKRDINDEDEEYDDDEEEGDDEEGSDTETSNDEDEEEGEEEEEEEEDEDGEEEEDSGVEKEDEEKNDGHGITRNKFKVNSSVKPFYVDEHSFSKIKIPDPDEISQSPFSGFHHTGRTGKTVNFGKPYSGSDDSDFITTEKSSSYENAPKKLTTRITPLTFTKSYQPANFSFGVNYKPKQRYKSTYVPKSPAHYNTVVNHKKHNEKNKKPEYEGSEESTTPYYSGYNDYSYSPTPQYTTESHPTHGEHSHYSDEDYPSSKTSYPSHDTYYPSHPSSHEAGYKKQKNSYYNSKHSHNPEITTSSYYHNSDTSDESGPQNERPSNHKYGDSYEETTPYYNAEVTTTAYESGEEITIPNSMSVPYANELMSSKYDTTTTEKPLAIKIHFHRHDEKVYEDDDSPSSTPQVFYHDYANDYDNYTEYADYSDYTGQPAADYDNITQTVLSNEVKTPTESKKHVDNKKTKEESDENSFKGQDFYNDYYETPSTTTKRHIYDSKTSTTNKEKLYARFATTTNPIQLDSYQNVILNLKNSKPPRDDSIYFNTTSYVYNFNKYETTPAPVHKNKKPIVGHLKKVTKPPARTTSRPKVIAKLKASNEIDYDTYPTSSSKEKIIYNDPQQDNSLISTKVRKKQELTRLSKPRIKLRTKPPPPPRVRITNNKKNTNSPLTKTKTTTDRDLSESQLHHTAVTLNKLNLITKTSVAPQQGPQQVYLQQSASPAPSYNYSSAINQFSQQQQPQKPQQQRPQQQFDTSYYNLYDDDDFYREDDYAQQFQNQNRGKIRDQGNAQISQQREQQKQQQQQNNVYNAAAQDYNEQYHLQSPEQDNRYEQPTKSPVVNATSTYSADSINPNNSSPPRLSFSFEQTPQPAEQRSNRFTIPETRPVLKPFSFNYDTPNTNDKNVFKNFESSLQRENTLPVVQLFQQDKPFKQQVESERQFQQDKTFLRLQAESERQYQQDKAQRQPIENGRQYQQNTPQRQPVENERPFQQNTPSRQQIDNGRQYQQGTPLRQPIENEKKYQQNAPQRQSIENDRQFQQNTASRQQVENERQSQQQGTPQRQPIQNERQYPQNTPQRQPVQNERQYQQGTPQRQPIQNERQYPQNTPQRQPVQNERQQQQDRISKPLGQQTDNNERKYFIKSDSNSNRNNFENEAQKNDNRVEQRDPKRIGQVRGQNDASLAGYKDFTQNGNFRIVVDETSTTPRANPSNDIRRFNPVVPTQKPRPFSSRDDTFYQPSKTEYVTKVPQLSQEYPRNFNETIKQRLNSALVGTALRGPQDSKQESSTPQFSTFNIKPSDFVYNNAEWKPTTPSTLNRGVRPAAAYLVESDKKGEYYLYSSESPKPGSTPKNPFEISTEEVVIVRQTNKPEENYRQSLPSTNVYTRLTTPANSINFVDSKQTASVNSFTRPTPPSISSIESNYRQAPNQFIKPTIQLPIKQNSDVKPWKFNVANKQITSEDVNRESISNNKFSTLSQVKSTIPSTPRPNTTPYTPYNYIKQITNINNNEIKSSTYRQQIRSTTPVPTSSRDFKEQQIRANQVKVTADRARVLEQNLQRNSLSRTPEANRFVDPTTMRFPVESTRFRGSKPAEVIKDNFVDSVSYNNVTSDDSDEYYYDDFEEYEEEAPVSKPNPPTLPPPPPSSSPPPTKQPTTTTVRAKPEPVRTQAPPRADDEKCVGSECNEKPLVRVRPTPSANQTTPIISSRGRVRGSATYTTASPDAERGDKPGSRSRPTLKPSQSIVAKAAASEAIDIYKFPPSRPESVYPTPQPDKTAAKCRKDVCLLPDCYCGGKDVPGDLPVEETPQIVLLTFDDSVNDLNKGLYADLFEKGRTNPNGCPISATFYVSHEWTDYSQVQNLYANGHEMASHTISHSFGEQFSQKKWTREIAGQREILAAYGGVRLDDIRGMRAPFLAVGGNKMFKMLYDSNFTYDSSMPVYENRPPSWPYTLDYKIFHDCMIPPCPTRSYPGVWEVPMVMWQDLNGGRCSMGDACSNPPDADGVYKMLLKNFERHFTTNRAPFGLYYHAAWFTQPHHKEGFINFIDTIVAMPEVWLVTNWQALQWVRDPTPINRLNSFQPFMCDYPERPKKCNNPKVCNLWHKSGVRYMRTCQPCPDVYPWTGLSGVKGSRVDNEIVNES
ncbi:hypothetical protein M8J77_006275 [Diaphorina citri]|nr:hypothetical protein M8J77_006275 [Diaphorina citri]